MLSVRKLLSLAAVLSLPTVGTVNVGTAQTSDPMNLEDVRLFQSFFADAMVSSSPYLGGAASAREYAGGNAVGLDAVGGYTFTPQLQIQGRLGYLRASPDGGDDNSGLTDLLVTGNYLFEDIGVNDAGEVVDIAVGGYTELPTGQEKVGGNTVDFGAYGALRHNLNNRVALTANVGLDLVKAPSSFTPGFCIPAIYLPVCTAGNISAGGRETSISLGGGTIYRAADELHLVGEVRIETAVDYAALSGGVDYTATFGRLRGALLVGLDDGAPNVGLVAQLLRSF